MRTRIISITLWFITFPFLVVSAFVAFLYVIRNKELNLKKINCIIYCFEKYIKHGGYIVIRKSHYGRYPHFLWAENIDDLKVNHIAPASKGPPRNIKELFIFEAVEKVGDKCD